MAEPIKANIDIDLGDLKTQIEEITGSVDTLFMSLGDHQDAVVSRMDKLSDAAKGARDATINMSRQSSTEVDGMLQKMNKIWDAYDDRIKDMQKAGGFKRAVAGMMPEQLAGVEQGMHKLKGSILSELPFGGILGLAMYGGMREEETRAMGTRIARQFQQAGQAGSKEMGRVGAMTRELGVALGKGPFGLEGQVSAAAAAFAQAGIDIETVMNQKFSTPIAKSRGSIMETSVALDNLFKQAAGTAARRMSELIADFNLSASQSADVVASIGLAARDSGTSVEAFSTSVMRSAQALRTQRADIQEVAEAQLRFQRTLDREMPGVSRQFSAGYAERAISQVTQGLAGMSVGLSAVLGERISQREPGLTGGQQVTGLQAYYAMREGFQGKGQTTEQAGVFTESVRELLSLAKENGRTVEEQRFFLERMGFGFEGSRALLDIGQEAEKSGNLQAAIKNNQAALNDSFRDAAKETSNFQKSLLRIQNGLAKLGAGVLGAMVSGFQGIIAGLKGIYYKLSGDEVGQEAAGIMFERAGESASMSVNLMKQGMQEAFGGMKMGLNAITGGRDLFVDEEAIRRGVEKRHADIAAGRIHQFDTKYGGMGEVTSSEIQQYKKPAMDEAFRVKQMAIGTALRTKTDVLMREGLYTELMNLYKKEEKRTGRGEQAVYDRMQQAGVRGAGGSGAPPQLWYEEQKAEENAYLDVKGVGRVKVKMVLQAVGYEGPKDRKAEPR